MEGFYSNYQNPMAGASMQKPIQSAMKVPTQIASNVAPTSEHLERLNLDIGSLVEVGHD